MRSTTLAIILSLVATVAAAPLPQDDPLIEPFPTGSFYVASSTTSSPSSATSYPASAIGSAGPANSTASSSTSTSRSYYQLPTSTSNDWSPWGKSDRGLGFPVNIIAPIIGVIGGLIILGLVIKFCCIGTAAVAASRAYANRPPPTTYSTYGSYGASPVTTYGAAQPSTLLYSGGGPQHTLPDQTSPVNPPPPYTAPPAYPEPVTRYG